MTTKVPGGKPHEKIDPMLGAEFGIGSNGEPSEHHVQADASETPVSDAKPRSLGEHRPGSGIPKYFSGI